MIVRISSVIVPQARLQPYLENVQSVEIPVYQAADGMVSVWLLVRTTVGYAEVRTVSLWRTEEELERFLQKQLSASAGDGEGVIAVEVRNYDLYFSGLGEHQQELPK